MAIAEIACFNDLKWNSLILPMHIQPAKKL